MNEHKQVGQAGNQAGKSMAGCSLNQGGWGKFFSRQERT